MHVCAGREQRWGLRAPEMHAEGTAKGGPCHLQGAVSSLLSPKGVWAFLSNLCVFLVRTGLGGEGSRARGLWELCLKDCLVGVTLAEIPTGILRIECEWKGGLAGLQHGY